MSEEEWECCHWPGIARQFQRERDEVRAQEAVMREALTALLELVETTPCFIWQSDILAADGKSDTGLMRLNDILEPCHNALAPNAGAELLERVKLLDSAAMRAEELLIMLPKIHYQPAINAIAILKKSLDALDAKPTDTSPNSLQT